MYQGISECNDVPSVRSVSVRVRLRLVGLCLGRCVATIELAKSSANLWGFCTLFALIPGIDDQGAVGGAGGPSGPSVLLSPRSIPKDKGGVPWAPSPPVTASGISYRFSLCGSLFIPEILSGSVALQESAVRALCSRGGVGE